MSGIFMRNDSRRCLQLTSVFGLSVLGIIALCCSCAAFQLKLPSAMALYSLPLVPDAQIERDGRNFVMTELGFETGIPVYC